MKKTKTKILVFGILAFILLGLLAGVLLSNNTPAYAQVETEQVVQENDIYSYFNDTVLPFIVSGIGGIVSFAIIIIPYIKKSGKVKLLEGAFASQKGENTSIKVQLRNINLDSIAQTINENVMPMLKADMVEQIKQLLQEVMPSEILKTVTELKADLLVVTAKVSNLIESAKLSWKEVEGASELLSKNPDCQVLTKLYERVREVEKKLKEQQSGETSEITALLNEIQANGGGNRQ